MPIYQYACPDCGNRFELKQKFTDNPVKKCPRCGRFHVYRVVGQVAVAFKGTGWYITDSRSSSEKKTLEHRPKEPATASASDAAESAATKSSAEKTEVKSTESKATETATKTTAKTEATKSGAG